MCRGEGAASAETAKAPRLLVAFHLLLQELRVCLYALLGLVCGVVREEPLVAPLGLAQRHGASQVGTLLGTHPKWMSIY